MFVELDCTPQPLSSHSLAQEKDEEWSPARTLQPVLFWTSWRFPSAIVKVLKGGILEQSPTESWNRQSSWNIARAQFPLGYWKQSPSAVMEPLSRSVGSVTRGGPGVVGGVSFQLNENIVACVPLWKHSSLGLKTCLGQENVHIKKKF